MKRRSLVCSPFALLALAQARANQGRDPRRILWVGNSQLSAGKLPAVFDALAQAQGGSTRSEALMKGGATLSDWLVAEPQAATLRSGAFDFVVLQERGGDLLGGFGDDVRARAVDAATRWVNLARERGVKPIILGTYQGLPEVSRALVAAEADLAQRLGVPYVAVSERFVAGRAGAPDLPWLAADGMHPGPALTLLKAMLMFPQILGRLPEPRGFALPGSQQGYEASLVARVLAWASSPPVDAERASSQNS